MLKLWMANLSTSLILEEIEAMEKLCCNDFVKLEILLLIRSIDKLASDDLKALSILVTAPVKESIKDAVF